MRKNIRPSFLDPRTKILIWLFGQCGGVHLEPCGFPAQCYDSLFDSLSGRSGKEPCWQGCWRHICYPGDTVLAVAVAARFFGYGLCYSNLLHSGVPLHCRRRLSDCHHQRQPVHSCFGGDGAPRSFSITLAVTLRFLPSLRQDLRHIRDAMALRNIRGFEEKLECIYVPMLMGQPRQQKNSASPPPARGIESPGKMSSWRPIGFHIQDVVVTLLFLALCVGGICCKGVLP